MRFATIDIVVALTLAIFVNASIVVPRRLDLPRRRDGRRRWHRASLSAADAGTRGRGGGDAVRGGAVGVGAERLDYRKPWPAKSSWRGSLASAGHPGRAGSRLACSPCCRPLFVVTVYGEESATRLLILSQVVLSLQRPSPFIPWVRLTGSKAWMGRFANGPISSAIAWDNDRRPDRAEWPAAFGHDGIARTPRPGVEGGGTAGPAGT